MKRKFSLRTQLIIIVLVFVVGLLGLTYLFQTTFLDDFYSKSKVLMIKSSANKVANYIDSNKLEDVIDEVSMSNEVCVRVISNDPRYNVIKACTLSNLDSLTINRIADETMANNGEKLFDNYKYRSASMETNDIYIYSKMVKLNGQYIMVLVSSLITPLTATISTIKSQYIIIVVVVVLMALLLALLLSRFIVKPIKNINDESKNLAKGKYGQKNMNFISSEFNELNSTLIQANEDILKADKARSELLANVSHDLRTPLTMIVGYGEMIRDIKEENNESNINIIIDEAKRLSTLVDDLIDISAMESGKVELHKQRVSLNNMLESVYHQYEKYCESQNVSFELKLVDDIEVEIDEHRIKQVLYNFINNSLFHNDKDDQKIILGSEIVDNKHRVYVYDNGKGIDPNNIDKIWDRYYKLNEEHKRQHIGSGIGLSLSKQILIAHNIEYGVESNLGEYSKFYLDL